MTDLVNIESDFKVQILISKPKDCCFKVKCIYCYCLQ